MLEKFKTAEITSVRSDVNGMISSLPIAKHLGGDLNLSAEKFRKGEKGLYNLIRLGVFGTIVYGVWTYVLPPVFIALGKFAAVAGVIIATVALIVAAPAIFKWIRKFARWLHKSAIKHDPFAELENQKRIMIQDQEKARKAHGKIKQLELEMKIEAEHNEKEAGELQTKIISTNGKAQALKETMDKLVRKHGQSAKGMDEYVNANSDLLRLLSTSERVKARLDQAQNFVSKYGTRASILKKASQRLTLVETVMDNKVEDFKATIEILKKDYEFAANARNATDAAKSAMHFDKSWQLDYALDVVTSSIAEDIAATSGNFKDIDTLTTNFNLDSDDMFASLEKIAAEIENGTNITPVARDYNNPEYKMTYQDELNSGGFGNMFN